MNIPASRQYTQVVEVMLNGNGRVSICPELIDEGRRPSDNASQEKNEEKLLELRELAQNTNLYAYDTMHKDGHCFISRWFAQAWDKHNCPKKDSFEPFIFAWIAFNGWASCVTSQERDKKIIESLSLNPIVCNHFHKLLNTNPSFKRYVLEFSSLWPVFSAKDLRTEDIRPLRDASREDLVKHYLEKRSDRIREYQTKAEEMQRMSDNYSNKAHKDSQNAEHYNREADKCKKQAKHYRSKASKCINYSPACWKRHADADQRISHDWSHTLAAIYQVRCNLFHGEKARDLDNDINLVHTAFRVLVHFLQSFPDSWRIHDRVENCR